MKKIYIFMLAAALFLGLFPFVRAQEQDDVQPPSQVQYQDGLVLDSDLDGLTDEGEKQIFLTDPMDPDTDGDGILDGAEIMGESDPFDAASPRAIERVLAEEQKETPWAWYITRSTGIVGFIMLYLSFFFGLAISTPYLKKVASPPDSLAVHRWTSIQAIVFSAIHGVSPLFDKFLAFSWRDVFIPFSLSSNEVLEKAGIGKEAVAFGTIALYLMLVLTVSSYLRKFVPAKLWRFLHSLNIIIYLMVVYHALQLGTDFRSGAPRYALIGANTLLGILIIFNLIVRMSRLIRTRLISKHEDLRQSDAPFEPERGGKNFRRGI